MPSFPSPLTPLSQEEFDTLDQWLLSDAMPESCMDIVTLEGFLTTIAIGPVTLSPTTWLPCIWGGGADGPTPRCDSLDAFNDLLSLIMRLYNDIVCTFEADPHAFTPTFYEHTVDGKTYTIVDEWCDGFLRGIQLAAGAWQPMFEQAPEMLRPLTLFGTPEGWAELEAAEDEEAMHAQWSSQIPAAVRAIHTHWLAYRRTSSQVQDTSTAKTRAQRAVSMRERKEVQAVLWCTEGVALAGQRCAPISTTLVTVFCGAQRPGTGGLVSDGQ